MEHNIQPSQQTHSAPLTQPISKNYSGILIDIFLLLLGIILGVLLGKTTLLSAIRIPYLGATPVPAPVAPSPTSTQNPTIIQAESLPNSTIINGWKHYENQRFSIEIPNNWNIFDYSNQKTYYGDIPTINLVITDDVHDPRNDKATSSNGSSNAISIGLGSEAYKDNKWRDLTSESTFFDLQSTLWTDIMRQSGGGALLQTTIQLGQLTRIKTVKRTNTWTQVMEGVDSTDTDFFFPDSKSSSQLLVWNINYRLPLKGNDITERKKTIDQILSTFKFVDQTADTSTWKTYTNTKYGYRFKYPEPDPVFSKMDIYTDDLVNIDGLDSLIFRIESISTAESSLVWWNTQTIEEYSRKPVSCFSKEVVQTIKSLYEPSQNVIDFGQNVVLLDGLNSTESKVGICPEPRTVRIILVPIKGKIIKIIYTWSSMSEKILSTFKFTQ